MRWLILCAWHCAFADLALLRWSLVDHQHLHTSRSFWSTSCPSLNVHKYLSKTELSWMQAHQGLFEQLDLRLMSYESHVVIVEMWTNHTSHEDQIMREAIFLQSCICLIRWFHYDSETCKCSMAYQFLAYQMYEDLAISGPGNFLNGWKYRL